MKIRYKKGYKYQLSCTYTGQVDIFPHSDIVTEYINLTTKGEIGIKKGYAWDGPSGPTFDTRDFMRGSLVHDALYQLIRQGYLSKIMWKIQADIELVKICKEDGMSRLRAWYVYRAVRLSDYLISWLPRKVIEAP